MIILIRLVAQAAGTKFRHQVSNSQTGVAVEAEPAPCYEPRYRKQYKENGKVPFLRLIKQKWENKKRGQTKSARLLFALVVIQKETHKHAIDRIRMGAFGMKAKPMGCWEWVKKTESVERTLMNLPIEGKI